MSKKKHKNLPKKKMSLEKWARWFVKQNKEAFDELRKYD